jgi:hypothetical protein
MIFTKLPRTPIYVSKIKSAPVPENIPLAQLIGKFEKQLGFTFPEHFGRP